MPLGNEAPVTGLAIHDAPQAQRFRSSLDFLSMGTIDTETALRTLLEQNDMWLRAATVWEIGIRGLSGFRDSIAEFLDSGHLALREAAGKAIATRCGGTLTRSLAWGRKSEHAEGRRRHPGYRPAQSVG